MSEETPHPINGLSVAGALGCFAFDGGGIYLMTLPPGTLVPFFTIGCGISALGTAGATWLAIHEILKKNRGRWIVLTVAVLCYIVPAATAYSVVTQFQKKAPIAALASGPAAPAESSPKVPDDEVPSILSLYATDFLKSGSNSLFGIGQNHVILPFKDGEKLLVLYTLFTNITENSKFLSVYIPASHYTFVAITWLSQNYNELLWMPDLIFNGPSAGQGDSTDNLVFTGKIFVYYETPLSLNQMGELSGFFQAAHASVEFRGPDYAIRAFDNIELGTRQYPPKYKIINNVPVVDSGATTAPPK